MIDGWGIFCEPALRWMSLDLTDDKSTLVQVMAWCRQATSHYLSQCWPRSLSPYGVTRPQWVKTPSLYWEGLKALVHYSELYSVFCQAGIRLGSTPFSMENTGLLPIVRGVGWGASLQCLFCEFCRDVVNLSNCHWGYLSSIGAKRPYVIPTALAEHCMLVPRYFKS